MKITYRIMSVLLFVATCLLCVHYVVTLASIVVLAWYGILILWSKPGLAALCFLAAALNAVLFSLLLLAVTRAKTRLDQVAIRYGLVTVPSKG